MSRQHDRPWTEEEKVYLLTEILKISLVQPSKLLNLIESEHIVPRWDDIPLPQGRPLRSCQNVFEEMRQSRRSFVSHVPSMFPSYGPPTPTPFIQQPALPQLQPRESGARKRPFQDIESTFSGMARNIQPRPSPSAPGQTAFATFTGTEGGPNILQSPGDTAEEPSRKKRGRPSKDEVQRREAEAAARGEVYQPKRRAPRKSIETSTSLAPSEAVGTSDRPESSLVSGQSSPKEQHASTTENTRPAQGEQPAGEPMETSSPQRPSEIASTPGPQPAEPRPYGSFQPHGPDAQYIHRPSSTPSSGPRYHPPLAPLMSIHQTFPASSSTASSGTGITPAFSHMFDTQAPPSRP